MKPTLRDYVTYMTIKHTAYTAETAYHARLMDAATDLEACNGPHLLSEYANKLVTGMRAMVYPTREAYAVGEQRRKNMCISDATSQLQAVIDDLRDAKLYQYSDRIRQALTSLKTYTGEEHG